MSFKDFINKQDDKSIMDLFMTFISTFNLQYQKINKQISYKCHEATWILASTKATGYGRTQCQAYRHALRNLIQILSDNPQHNDFFNKYSLARSPIRSKISIKSQIKTQNIEERDITKTDQIRQSFKKNINDKKTDLNYQYSKQTPHSKIMLNKSFLQDQQNVSQNQIQLAYTKKTLIQAKQKVRDLQKILTSLNNQNQNLREKIKKQSSYMYIEQVSTKDDQKNLDNQIKIAIPRLKLQILPNYHKNSQKSLNSSLLAAYNEKYGVLVDKN